MKKGFKEIIENEFDCLIDDVDFVILEEGNLQNVINCMNQALTIPVVMGSLLDKKCKCVGSGVDCFSGNCDRCGLPKSNAL